MIREVDFELKRAVRPLEWHCFKNNALRRFVLRRTDRAANYCWHFRSLPDAITFVRKRGGGTFCTVDSFGCVETVRHLSALAQMTQKIVSNKACQISRDAVKPSRNCEKAKVAHDGAVK